MKSHTLPQGTRGWEGCSAGLALLSTTLHPVRASPSGRPGRPLFTLKAGRVHAVSRLLQPFSKPRGRFKELGVGFP